MFPRPDRPWSDDATSNAPTIGRKRRISSTEMDTDDDPNASLSKRPRGSRQQTEDEEEGPATQESSPAPPAEGVKEVTTGVKTIDLNSKDPAVSSSVEESLPATSPAVSDPSQIPIPDTDSVEGEEEDAKKDALSDEPPAAAEIEESAEVVEKADALAEGVMADPEVEVKSSKEDDPVQSKPLHAIPDTTGSTETDEDTTGSLPSAEPKETAKEDSSVET